jgi:cytidine deaminase
MSSVTNVPTQGDPAQRDAAPAGDLGQVADWDLLRRAADAAAARAYAPYSGLRVGAAGLSEDGAVVSGCNIENASFGLTLCAECGLVSALVGGGHGRLLAVSVTAGDGRPLAPCGRCRQLLMEHGGADLLVDGGPSALPQRLSELLPGAFGAADIAARGGQDHVAG